MHNRPPAATDTAAPYVLADPGAERRRRIGSVLAIAAATLTCAGLGPAGATARPALDSGGGGSVSTPTEVDPPAEDEPDLADPGPRELRPDPAESEPEAPLADPGPTELRGERAADPEPDPEPEPPRSDPPPQDRKSTPTKPRAEADPPPEKPARERPEPDTRSEPTSDPAPLRDPGPRELRPGNGDRPAEPVSEAPSAPEQRPPADDRPDPDDSTAAEPQEDAPIYDPGPRELRPGSGERPPSQPQDVEPPAPAAEPEDPAPIYDPGPRELRPGNGERPPSQPQDVEPPAPAAEPEDPAPLYDPGPRELRPGNGDRPASEPPSAPRPDIDPVHSDPHIPMYDPGPRELRPGDGERPELPPIPDIISIGDGPSVTEDDPSLYLPYPGEEGRSVSGTPTCKAGYNGRGSATCTGIPPKAGPKHRKDPKVKAGATIETSATSTSGRSTDYLTPDGERTNLTVSLETVTKLGGEAALKHAGVGYKRIVNGDRTTYVLTVSPERAEQIANGTAEAPNPHDPRTLEQGDGLVLNEDQFGGESSNLTLEEIASLEIGREDGDRQSAGVRRIDEDTVRVTVGDEEFVRNSIRAGLDVGDLGGVSVWNSDESSEGDLTQVDFDISTPQGWEDYQRFINTGRVPHRSDIPHAEVDRDAWTSTSGSSGKVGPLEWSSTDTNLTGNVQHSENNDGSEEWTATFRDGQVSQTRTESRGADGQDGEAENTLLLQDVDSDFYDAWTAENGGDRLRDSDGESVDVRVDLSDDDLHDLRATAIDALRRQAKEDGYGDVSPSEMVRMVRDSDSDYVAPMGRLDEESMVRAETPEDILMALYDSGRSSSDNVAVLMREMGWHQDAGDRGTSLPGTTTVIRK